MHIAYTIVDCWLGRLLVAWTERGICAVSLGDDDAALEAALVRDYPRATAGREGGDRHRWVLSLVDHLDGRQPHLDPPLDVQATAFQHRVWKELQAIPYGATRTYSQIAAALGQPTAFRAVGRACATNPVSIVVPCHRAVHQDGGLAGYRWGLDRKRALIEQERVVAGSFPPSSDAS
jgi:AraC family transcriptional regulator of adaptative response/methylated-DNA-[protein]-cysteine methyltransferase